MFFLHNMQNMQKPCDASWHKPCMSQKDEFESVLDRACQGVFIVSWIDYVMAFGSLNILSKNAELKPFY